MGEWNTSMGRSTRKRKGTLVHHRSGSPAVCRPIVASLFESTLARAPERSHLNLILLVNVDPPQVEAVERDQEENGILARLVQQIVVVDMKHKSRPKKKNAGCVATPRRKWWTILDFNQ
jgi:hypothetical protein